MAKKKRMPKIEKVEFESEIVSVSARQLKEELEKEKGVTVLKIQRARTITPRSEKTGNELKPKQFKTSVMVKLEGSTKAKKDKVQKIIDEHKPKTNESKEELVAQVETLLKKLDALRD